MVLVLLNRSMYSKDGILYAKDPDGTEIPENNSDGSLTLFPSDALPQDAIARALFVERRAKWKKAKPTDEDKLVAWQAKCPQITDAVKLRQKPSEVPSPPEEPNEAPQHPASVGQTNK